MSYWKLVEPVWDTISIYDGPETFLEQFNAAPKASRVLFAAHWCQSEVKNGGFLQFFSNSTGVLAPEAVQAFTALGMPKTAQVLQAAMSLLGSAYPRCREDREEVIEAVFSSLDDEDRYPFDSFDEDFFDLLKQEGGGFEASADLYARTCA